MFVPAVVSNVCLGSLEGTQSHQTHWEFPTELQLGLVPGQEATNAVGCTVVFGYFTACF